MNEEKKCILSVQHILAVIIGAIGSVQQLTVIQIKLQPFVCTLAVIGLTPYKLLSTDEIC